MRETAGGSALRQFRDELVDLANRVADSVVTVRLDTVDFAGGVGSGWFVEPGMVVTNHHVVRGDRPKFTVRMRGGRVVLGDLVGSDPRTDLALLRVDELAVPALPLRTNPLAIGELCFAFGSPLGDYTESVSLGIVSGLGRRMQADDALPLENLIQTDAEINPGNSGGPLVDLDGAVLGINTMILSTGRGMGFAVPATTVSTIVPELIEHGEILRPRLGVTLEAIDHWHNGAQGERLRVARAPGGSPLRSGDLLLALGGAPIRDRSALFDVMRRPLIGRPTEIVVERDGAVQFLEITMTL